MSTVANGKYTLKKKLGSGSFGDVYSAEDMKSHELIALKVEQITSDTPQLEYEATVSQELQDRINVPRFYSFESDKSHRFLSMELLGKSLDDLFYICNQKFSLKTVLMIIDQTLNAIEFIHRMNFIYRDIKPNNFLIGKNDFSNQIFLVDFGLVKKYRKIDGEHIKFKTGQSIVGTTRFASVNALKGNRQSRKDDMIALGYLWIFFLKGTLPWAGIDRKDENHDCDCKYEGKYDKMISMKLYTSPDKLCQDLPKEFSQYLTAVSSLEFEEEPKYSDYRLMFRKLFIRCQFSYDYKYDWSNNPLVDPEPPKIAPRQKTSIRRRPVSERLLPLSPHERLTKNDESFGCYATNCNEKRERPNSVRLNQSFKNDEKKRENTDSNNHYYDNFFNDNYLQTPRRMKTNTSQEQDKIKVSPPLPRKVSRPPHRNNRNSFNLNQINKENICEETVDKLGPVKPPISRTKNVPILPNITNVIVADKNKARHKRSSSVRSARLSGTSILPAFDSDIKLTPDPISKHLFTDFFGNNW
ncbi:CK1 family protein kinase [Tritrichomonas foetus]|uniref:non-specific serine/threonine protein kinase n=1 Tax=Tritrichomonas foetus TaxID=1144522 RepID=A0A1J4KST5_9EUKA|nr:CK1 family protein kinase [Tritrichomonas foetus]|eukprot:OHT14353.1 CK1 family protein kinase [Tritrichomonas foetus]